MDKTDWAFVGRTEELAGDGPHHVSSGGVDAVLVRVDGELRAFEGRCPHQGALLGEGELVDGQLVCRNHRWCFDTESGARVGGPQCLQRFPLRVADGRVELELGVVEEARSGGAARSKADLPGPRGLPLIGSALELGPETFHLDLERLCRKHGSTYQLEFGWRSMLVTSEPEIIADVLKQRPDTFTRLAVVQPIFEELGIHGVFSEEGESWRSQRRLAMSALSPRQVKKFFEMLQTLTCRLMQRWERAAEEGRTVDLQSDLMRFTVDVTTRLAFSEETNTLGGESNLLLEQIDPMFPKLSKRVNSVFPYWRWFKLPSDRRVERSLEEVREWLGDVIARTRSELEADPERAANPQNFLESMVVARDAEGELFDDNIIFGNAVTMLLAGEDTTANTLAWAVHLLLDAPEAEAVLRRVVDETLGESRVADSMETAKQLDAVMHVANETMRLKPVAPILAFTSTRDTVVGDLSMDANTSITLLLRMPGVDPAHVDEPGRFLPERWQDPRLLARMQRSGTFVPFGSGPRICPGRSLALLEIRMVLSMLYRNFDVERVGRAADVDEVFGFTMSPRGLRVRLRRRGVV